MPKSRHLWKTIIVGILILAMAGCASAEPATEPSSEEAPPEVEPTEEPPPPTSTPMPTATPIPFDLIITLVDGIGNPVTWAEVSVPESGDDEPVAVDEAGQASWLGLAGKDVNIKATAQGFAAFEESATLEHGPNDLTFTLERDRLQILPTTACQEGQDVLYLEDFEDGAAQGWNDLSRPTWSFSPVDDHGTVLSAFALDGVGINYDKMAFGNAVWSMDMAIGSGSIQFIWHWQETSEETMLYMFAYNPADALHVHRWGESGQMGEARIPVVEEGVWQHIDITYFEGALDFWLDGVLLIGVNDPDPILEGGMQILSQPVENPAPVLFDNLVVCSLNEPYTPPPPSADDETIFLDNFDGGLDESWMWLNEDPSAWQITDEGWLEITASDPGFAADSPDIPQVNFLTRPIPQDGNDLIITTHLIADPDENFEQATLFLYEDGDSYVSVNIGFCGVCATGRAFYLETAHNGAPLLEGLQSIPLDASVTEVWLRIEYSPENNFAVALVAAEEGEWQLIGAGIRNTPLFTMMGVGATNLPGPEANLEDNLIALFDWVSIALP